MTPDEIFNWIEQFFNSPRPYIMAPVHAWLEGGADFEKDIKPICERFMKKGKGPPGRLDWLNDDIFKSIALRKATPTYSALSAGVSSGGGRIGYSEVVKERDRRWQESQRDSLRAWQESNPWATSPDAWQYARTLSQAIAMGIEYGPTRLAYDSMAASGNTHCRERLAAFKAQVMDCIDRGVIEIRLPEWVPPSQATAR